MALQYGLNLPTSNIKQILERYDKTQSGVRSWSQLFGGASLGYGAQSDALTADYSSAMAQAYKANFEQNAAIMSGGLSTGGTKQLLAMNRQDLQNTYDTYIRNYASDLSGVAEGYSEEVGMLDDALTERAENFSNTLNAMIDYREQLFDYGLVEEGQDTLSYLSERGLDWLTDKNGNLLTRNELGDIIFNDDMSLTDRGIEFFDAMSNTTSLDVEGFTNSAGEKAKGFDEWFSETNPELREWLSGSDDFNYNFTGRNRGTINVLTGRESTDNTIERTDYDVLSGSKEGGFQKFRETIEKKVWNTLENNGRDGINTISEIGNRKKKAEGKLKSYNEWFDYAQNVLNKKVGGSVWGKDENAVSLAMNSYIEDYKKYSKTEFETFSSELTNMFGEKTSSEFWNTYGKEVQELYDNIQAFDKKATRYIGSSNIIAAAKNVENALNTAKQLRDMGFDKAMQNLYKNLEKFLAQQQKKTQEERRKVSGF